MHILSVSNRWFKKKKKKKLFWILHLKEDATAVHHTCVRGKASLFHSHKSHFCVCVTARERGIRYCSEMIEEMLYGFKWVTHHNRKWKKALLPAETVGRFVEGPQCNPFCNFFIKGPPPLFSVPHLVHHFPLHSGLCFIRSCPAWLNYIYLFTLQNLTW